MRYLPLLAAALLLVPLSIAVADDEYSDEEAVNVSADSDAELDAACRALAVEYSQPVKEAAVIERPAVIETTAEECCEPIDTSFSSTKPAAAYRLQREEGAFDCECR